MDLRYFGVAAAAACLVFASGSTQADTRVGVTSAVNPSAAGTPPGADSRQLVVGSDIVFRERVLTTTDGQAQILFLDQSSLLIGPNSTVVIDEFVYDPATNKGNIAATLTQGSFRYIGGKLSKQGNATLKTPVATLGIRGSDITVGYSAANRSMNVVTTHGAATVTAGSDVVALRSGFGLIISGIESRLGTPTALSAAQIAAVNRVFEGLPGRTAGAGTPPTDGDVADSGLSETVEAKGLAETEPAAGGPSGNLSLALPFSPGNNDTQPLAIPPAPPPGNPQAPPRTSRMLNGYVAGLSVPTTVSNSTVAVLNTKPNFVTIRTSADADGIGRVDATFAYRPAPQGSYGSAPQSSTNKTRIEFGDPPGSGPATQSVFANDQSFAAGQLADAEAGKARLNGFDVGVAALLVSVPIVTPVGAITDEPGRTAPACACQFVTWGMWSAVLTSSPSGTTLQSVPNGFWVAGVLPDVSDPSPTGTATFSGTAIGAVTDQAQQRLASGTFTNAYNFNQRSGLVTISNFDGVKSTPKTFSGTVTAGEDWRSYRGSLSGSNLTGSLNGSFYGSRNAAGQPKETAGNFAVRGTGYTASGIFLGTR